MDCVRCGDPASRTVHIDGSKRPERPICLLCWGQLVVWFTRNGSCPDGHEWIRRVNSCDQDFQSCNRCGLTRKED